MSCVKAYTDVTARRPSARAIIGSSVISRDKRYAYIGCSRDTRVINFFLYASVSAASVDVATIRQYDLPEPSEANNTRTHAVDATLLGHRTLIITLVIEAAAPPGRTARPYTAHASCRPLSTFHPGSPRAPALPFYECRVDPGTSCTRVGQNPTCTRAGRAAPV